MADNGLAADTGEPTAATDSTDSTDRTDSTETPGAAAGRVDGESAT